MLSRRSVRIKVMQLLYILNRDESVAFPELVKQYNEGIWATFELYIFHLNYILRLAQYAEKDAVNRAAKLMPSEEDKNFKPILATNPCTKSLAENVGFKKLTEKYQSGVGLDEDHIRTLYHNFCDTAEFKKYISQAEHTDAEHAKILLDLYKFLSSNDLFIEITDDRYNNWFDDESLVTGAMKKTLKSLPSAGEFYKDHEPADETVREFGEQLLRKVCQEDANLFAHIEPALKNWEADRVAVLDMIMLKMALCELLNFPTIPTKVTLNEFVEISKGYSTDKSKDFINGILDRLMKKLQKEEKIIKEGRGLIE